MKKKAPTDAEVNIVNYPESAGYQEWKGASIFSSLGSFNNIWISKEHWEESPNDCDAESFNSYI